MTSCLLGNIYASIYCTHYAAKLSFSIFNSQLNHLPSIVHLLAQYRAEDHLYIFDEAIIAVVVAVEAHLIGVYHIIVVPTANS